MGWREEAIKKHEAEIADARGIIEAIDDGTFNIDEVSSGGQKSSLNADLKSHYSQVIAALEAVLADLKSV